MRTRVRATKRVRVRIRANARIKESEVENTTKRMVEKKGNCMREQRVRARTKSD